MAAAESIIPPTGAAPSGTPPSGTPDPAPAPSGDALPPSLIPGETPPPTEPKPGDPPPGEKPPGDKPADPPAATVPEKYDFSKLELPQGVTLNNELMTAMEPAFKEAGLSQDAANKLVKSHAEQVAKLQAAFEQQQTTDFNNWMSEQARTHDKTIRTEWGTDYDGNFNTAQRALARFFQDKEFYRVLDETGIVRQPAFMRGLLNIGRMIKEDVPPGGAASGGRKSDAEVFYPTTK